MAVPLVVYFAARTQRGASVFSKSQFHLIQFISLTVMLVRRFAFGWYLVLVRTGALLTINRSLL